MGRLLLAHPTLVLSLLAALSPHAGLSLEILKVSLNGGLEDYLEMGTKADYILNCEYRTAYDDTVEEVRWVKFGQPVYTWSPNSNPTVYQDLLGLVDASPTTGPHNLHFTAPLSYSLAGDYTCHVVTANKAASVTYTLQVVDADSGPYSVVVESLSKINKENNSSINSSSSSDSGGGGVGAAAAQNKYDAYQVVPIEDTPEQAEVVFEDEDCTLLWSLETPAIFPRPNVTCGHYSFDHQDVIKRLPAGLTMHKFPNGSWSASFYRTHVQVSSIPKNHRLGCSIRIPDTTYKRVERAQDDLVVDNLIDTGGCPGLADALAPGVKIDVTEATFTCRGDVLPADRTGRALASLSCPEDHVAVFPDGKVGSYDWGLYLSCAENDMGWRVYSPEEPARLGSLVDLANVPICVPGVSGAGVMGGKVSSLTLALTTALAWLLHA